MLAGPVSAALALVAGGCTIGLPFRGPGFDSERGVVAPGAGDTVVVAVTQGVVSGGKGRAFGRQLRQVLDALPERAGLIAFSVRRELFGRRVWTLSAWVDHASLNGFLRSEAHRQAVREGGIPREAVCSARVRLPADALPIDWDRALDILAAECAAPPEAETG